MAKTVKNMTPKVVKAKYSYAGNGGAVGTYGLGAIIPKGAIVTNVWYVVNTTVTTAGADAGTLAIQIEGANDVVAALAVSNAANIWDAGYHATKIPFGAVLSAAADGTYALDPEGNAINYAAKFFERGTPGFLATTADRELSVVVASQAVTAGDLDVFVEYVI